VTARLRKGGIISITLIVDLLTALNASNECGGKYLNTFVASKKKKKKKNKHYEEKKKRVICEE
jgi:hypothetical protein